MTVTSLKWQQVNTWRLAQHGLLSRFKKKDFVKAAARTGGLQAQLMSAAELAMGVRTDGLSPHDIQAALWQERTLVKTWMMRGTLHLLAAHELPLYAAARSMHDDRNWLGYFTYYGITPAQYQTFLTAVPQVLGGEPMTREELAIAVGKHIKIPKLGKLLLSSSWGSLWKPSALRGDLCFGPNKGRHVTFVNPQKWLADWQPVEPQAALQEMARRYLRAYGPATSVDFARWWDGGAGLTAAKALFKSIDSELEAVDVEGWPAFALCSTLKSIQKTEPVKSVRLLPLFDAYVVGLGRDLDMAYKRLVFRPQGWISAVLLIDGNIKGVWDTKTVGAQTTVKLLSFVSITPALKKAIEAEAERLGDFWNRRVVVVYEGS